MRLFLFRNMLNSIKHPKVLFFTPHADDLEFGAPFASIQCLKLGWDVVEVLMTNCEYGTKRIEFRGNRLRQIRMRELENTVKVYAKHTNNYLNIIKMGFIDGFLPMNNAALNSVIKVLRKEMPNVVFAPDPWFSTDYHRDHLNTGLLSYFALKRLEKSERPQHVFFFYSFKPNIGFKSPYKDFKIVIEALAQYNSQITPLKMKLTIFSKKLSLLCKSINMTNLRIPFREYSFDADTNKMTNRNMLLKDRLRYFFYSNIMHHPKKMYAPTPKELGLIKI